MPTTDRAAARETRILADALEALTRVVGLTARTLEREPVTANGTRPDATIEVEYAQKRHRYYVDVKTVDRKVTLNQAKQDLDRYGKQGLVVAPYLTAELANYCREIDLQFIDAAGNAYLQGPGMFVHVRGERPPALDKATTAPKGAGTPTALRVIFALLCKPELLNAPYRDIAAAAGVALGTIGWVFFDLEKRGYVVGGKEKGDRKFVDAIKLAKEWVTNYAIRLRPKLAARKFRAMNPNWWRTAQLKKYNAVWGGEVAADRLTGNREPGTFTIYLPDDPGEFVLENRLRADPNGDIELLQKFWHFEPRMNYDDSLAPPLLVYADLMATLDTRNHDTAKQIEDRVLANALPKT
jgi:hypothetical protein